MKAPVEVVYGDAAIDLVLAEIEKLKEGSNIPFDAKYVNLGVSFLTMKATQILLGEKKKTSLENLVSEAFGEAAMYKYNVNGGVL
jgi:hypothetical protein